MVTPNDIWEKLLDEQKVSVQGDAEVLKTIVTTVNKIKNQEKEAFEQMYGNGRIISTIEENEESLILTLTITYSKRYKALDVEMLQ